MKKNSGFTLVEILVVVMIITILATIVGINVIPRLGQAKTAQARTQIAVFKTALSMYRMDNDVFPTQEQGLTALCQKPTTPPIPQNYRQRGYLDSSQVPLDPWKRKYVYLVPGPNDAPYEIVCYGADGAIGGRDDNADISSSNLGE